MFDLVVAGWFVSSCINKVLELILWYAKSKYHIGFNNKLQKFHVHLEQTQAAITEAMKRKIENQALKDWLWKLKGAVYAAENVLDGYEYEVLKDKARGKRQVGRISASKIVKLHKLVTKLINFRNNHFAKVMKEFCEINKEISLFLGMVRLKEANSRRLSEIPKWRQTTSSANFILIGRQTEENRILKVLNGSAEEFERKKNYFVLSIVGPGGIGKTALAQVVYNHSDLDHSRFDIKAWVCISNDFDVARLSIEIIESAPFPVPKGLHRKRSPDVMEKILTNVLKDRRFLLVFDDVWEESGTNWSNLCKAFGVAKEGSMIIVTTRNENVAKMMEAKMIINLDGLGQQDYCNLLKQSILTAECHAEKNTVSKLDELARQLGGSPLAAITFGRVLKLNIEENNWGSLLHRKIYELEQNVGDIVSVLRLSYDQLSEELKQCYLACSLFPKYYSFNRDELLSVWMALGFVNPKNKNDGVEDLAEIFLYKLSSRSFFINSGKLQNEFEVHAVLHELAEFLSGGEYHRLEDKRKLGTSNEIPESTYHVYVSADNLAIVSENLRKKRNLRSLVVGGSLSPCNPKPVFLNCLAKVLKDLKFLRLLILNEFHHSLLEHICNLKHLRYLQLPGHSITYLPDGIGKLYQLLWLNLKMCSKQLLLSKDMNKLLSLRYLKADPEVVSSIPEIGKLTALLELEDFHVRSDAGFDIGQLSDMNELRRIGVKNLQLVDTKENAAKARLHLKSKLEFLKLHWHIVEKSRKYINGPENEMKLEMNNETAEVFESLRPPDSLREVIIEGYMGSFISKSWLIDSRLYRLRSIELSDCHCLGPLPPFGELRCLKVLRFRHITGVHEVGAELYGKTASAFPELEELVFDQMSDWCLWHKVNNYSQMFPRLQKLDIRNCSKLVGLSLQPILEKREVPLFSAAVHLDQWDENKEYCSSALTISTDCFQLFTTCIEKKCLPSLCRLEIHGGQILESFNSLMLNLIEYLSSLKQLCFINCYTLLRLPAELVTLPSLQSLYLETCPEICDLPEMLSGSLKELHVNNCSEELKEYCRKMILNHNWLNVHSIAIDGEELIKCTRSLEIVTSTDASESYDAQPQAASFVARSVSFACSVIRHVLV